MAPLGPFEQTPELVVAVSGGADSMALCLLAHDWAQTYGGRVIGLTVEHGLREESAAEAAQVGQWLVAYGIEHHILPLDGLDPNQPNLQETARDARYHALCSWCREHGILHLLLAHHSDDQAETFIMRMARGSGVDGLAGMAVLSQRDGIQLLRPLLNVSKARLCATLEAYGQPWIEDASNQSSAYTRNRIRQVIERLEKGEVTAEKFAHATAELGRVRASLETITARHLTRYVEIFPEGYAQAKLALFEEEQDLALRALAALITTIGGNATKPRMDHLERALDTIRSGSFQRLTLGGCFVTEMPRTKERGTLLISREWQALESERRLIPHQKSVWDKRFEVTLAEEVEETALTIGALGQDGIRDMAEKQPWISTRLPKAVLYTLPAIRRVDELLAVPHIHYTTSSWREGMVRVQFHPPKSLAGPAFCWLNKALQREEEERA